MAICASRPNLTAAPGLGATVGRLLGGTALDWVFGLFVAVRGRPLQTNQPD
jgi:hypothetical protein